MQKGNGISKVALTLGIVGVICLTLGGVAYASPSLETVLEMPHRAESASRDSSRNPLATLNFFDVQPSHTVVEIWPGGGWYTQILAPLLKSEGQLYGAHFNPNSSVAFFKTSRAKFETLMQDSNELYGKVKITSFDPPALVEIAPKNSVDRVLTFRNIHNWYMRGAGEKKLKSALNSFYAALKPGGILGIVEHRLPESRPNTDQQTSGYMKQSYVIEAVESVGFRLLETSEINANPKDTADHPNGVWTLPPRLRIDQDQQDTYRAIGESDRMTLKFIKPM